MSLVFSVGFDLTLLKTAVEESGFNTRISSLRALTTSA